MSKLSQLKQDAYQAGKKRDWDRALGLYEQILELDKGNPTIINEMGDLCLKAGQTTRGVQHFLNAAAKYRHNGLTNNAVAIYKKILRYDSENLNAHWFLAESRAGQGLLVEGEHHALVFLDNKEGISGELQEIYLKRCSQLLELYGESRPVLDNLLQVFRLWNMMQEAGRTRIRIACHKWDDQQEDEARQMVAEALEQTPQLANYQEHGHWQKRVGTGPVTASPDFDAVELPSVEPAPAAALSETPEPAVPDPAVPDPDPVTQEIPTAPATGADLGWGAFDASEPPAVTAVEPDPEPAPTVDIGDPFAATESSIVEDEEGCISLDDTDTGPSFDDLIAQATAQVEREGEAESDPAGALDLTPEPAASDSTSSEPGTPEAAPTGPESLDDLLGPGDGPWQASGQQVETISEEIGAQVGGAQDEAPSSLYETGMVYLEMGMHDQACESFRKASAHPEYTVRAHEMWGITLLRIDRVDEAINVLSEALSVPADGSHEKLGLLYHLGRAYEQAERDGEAQAAYLQIQEAKPGFLDVGRRLSLIESNL